MFRREVLADSRFTTRALVASALLVVPTVCSVPVGNTTASPHHADPPSATYAPHRAAPSTRRIAELTLTLPGDVPLALIYCSTGEFTMGNDDRCSEGNYLLFPNSYPPHTVRIEQPFYLGKYEVTQEQWQAIMASNPSRFQADKHCPVEQVSWQEAVRFCERASSYLGKRVRLPFEREWEYACTRGTLLGSTTRASGPESSVCAVAWCDLNSGGRTHSVGFKPADRLGFCDMLGNVSEWCQDRYLPYPGATWPAEREPYYVRRGGNWQSLWSTCASYTIRGQASPGTRDARIGFRVVVETAALDD